MHSSIEEFADYTFAMLFFSYHAVALFGLHDGLSVVLPRLYAKKRFEFYEDVMVYARAFIIACGVVYLAVCILFLGIVNFDLLYICLLALLIILPYQMYNTEIYRLRFRHQFVDVYRLRRFFVIAKIVIQFPLIFHFNARGYFLGELLAFTGVLLWFNVGFSLKNINFHRFKKTILYLVKYSAPLFLSGVIALFIANGEKTLSAIYLSSADLAIVGFSTFFTSLLVIVLGQVLSVFSQISREQLTLKHDGVDDTYMSFLILSALIYIFGIIIVKYILDYAFYLEFLSQYSIAEETFFVFGIIGFLKVISSVVTFGLVVYERRAPIIRGQFAFAIGLSIILWLLYRNQEIDLCNLLGAIILSSTMQFVYLLWEFFDRQIFKMAKCLTPLGVLICIIGIQVGDDGFATIYSSLLLLICASLYIYFKHIRKLIIWIQQ